MTVRCSSLFLLSNRTLMMMMMKLHLNLIYRLKKEASVLRKVAAGLEAHSRLICAYSLTVLKLLIPVNISRQGKVSLLTSTK